MPISRRFLEAGEEVLVEVHLHWRSLGAPALATVLALAGFFAAVVLWGSAPLAVAWTLVALVAVPASWLAWRLVRWGTTLLVVTDRRVLLARGPRRRRATQVLLYGVLHVQARRSLSQRLVGSGSVLVTLASGGIWTIDGVPRPAAVRDAALAARRALVGGVTAERGAGAVGRGDLDYR